MLFSPFELRSLTLKNRLVLSPMCQYSVDIEDGIPTDWHLVHLGSRAAGGFGLVLTEATAVSGEGRISPRDTGLWNTSQQEVWSRITSFVHGQGAAVGVQLAHAGRKAGTWPPFAAFRAMPHPKVPESDGGWQALGPESDPFPGYATPRAMSRGDIQGTVADFAEAAGRADAAGFDVVEIHAAHGYLLHEFLSPLSNHRTDEYGGDLAARLRFPLEVMDAVRSVWPEDKPLLVRISATDWIEGGLNCEDACQISRALADHGADLIDCSSGGTLPASVPAGPGYQTGFSARIREQAAVPTGAVGLITEPHQAEQILVDGAADLVLVGRAALREPAWPQRAAFALRETRPAPYPPQYERGEWQ